MCRISVSGSDVCISAVSSFNLLAAWGDRLEQFEERRPTCLANIASILSCPPLFSSSQSFHSSHHTSRKSRTSSFLVGLLLTCCTSLSSSAQVWAGGRCKRKFVNVLTAAIDITTSSRTTWFTSGRPLWRAKKGFSLHSNSTSSPISLHKSFSHTTQTTFFIQLAAFVFWCTLSSSCPHISLTASKTRCPTLLQSTFWRDDRAEGRHSLSARRKAPCRMAESERTTGQKH